MYNENEEALEGVEELEENTQEEETDESEEETVTIPKSKYSKMQRKAQAYDATKDAPTARPQKNITNNSDTKWREKMELKVEGYDNEATDFIMKNGGKKALENPFILKAIEAMKEQKFAEKATIDEGSKSQTEKRFSPQEFAKLTASEQQKVLSEL